MYNVINKMSGIHPKIEKSIVLFLSNMELYDFRFFGEFGTYINYEESKDIPTAGVFYRNGKIFMAWNRNFIDNLPQEQATFLFLHEISHLLGNCHKRVEYNNLNHKYANIAHDMVINSSLIDDEQLKNHIQMIPKGFVIPDNYNGDKILEPIYAYIRDHDKKAQEKKDQNGKGDQEQQDQNDQEQQDQNGQSQGDQEQQDQNGQSQGDQEQQDQNGQSQDDQEQQDQNGQGQGQGQGQGDQEQQGQNGNNANPLTDNISNDIPTKKHGGIGDLPEDSMYVDQGKDGQTMDVHFDPKNKIEKEMLEKAAKDITEKLKNRGLISSNVERIIGNLEKKPNNWLNQLKRWITGVKGVGNYSKTFKRQNRYGIEGLRGKRKDAIVFDVILDTSGSMTSDIPKVLGTILRDGITCNIVQIDTEVQSDTVISSPRELKNINLKGFGGTVLQPAIDYIGEKKQQARPLVIMTDGYTDHLDISKIRDKVVVLTTGVNPPISGGNVRFVDCSLY
jgi:predicted metal-dependent peptidase